MDIPATRYATTEDGISIAFQTVGDGPVDLVFDPGVWGNVEIMWELAALADLFGKLSSFSRLILYDRRGTGMSGGGGNSLPNLETRARDLLTILDTCRSSRPALFGSTTGGAALALFAATYPDRVSSFVWFWALATVSWSPGYPWGATPEELRRDTEWIREGVGKPAMAREWLESHAPKLAGDDRLVAQVARALPASDLRAREVTKKDISGDCGRDFPGGLRLEALNGPGAMALDANGDLYFVDANNHRIRRVTQSGVITTIAGNGAEGFTGDGGPPISAEFDAPLD